jgi:hypothetical protein
VRLVFLGDSITDFWHLGPNPWFPTLRCGRTIWDESFAGQPFAAYSRYLDLYSSFVDASGQQLSQHFNDGLHPSESGYRVWRNRLVPYLGEVWAAQVAGNLRPWRVV